jgi:hypothetical protein
MRRPRSSTVLVSESYRAVSCRLLQSHVLSCRVVSPQRIGQRRTPADPHQIGDYIAKRINSFHPKPNRPYFVLGLPTGSSPLPVYKRLVELHQKGALSFKVGPAFTAVPAIHTLPFLPPTQRVRSPIRSSASVESPPHSTERSAARLVVGMEAKLIRAECRDVYVSHPHPTL